MQPALGDPAWAGVAWGIPRGPCQPRPFWDSAIHPLWLLGKNSQGGNFIYPREFSRKELVSQRLPGGLLGVEEPPLAQFHPREVGRAGGRAPTSCVMASEDESMRRRFMGDFCCDSTNARYVISCNS